ncbi:coiled-coil and C2 domain-containing protein 1B-like [Equus asinus]|uniref:coiled-coil and C2 domain-containing protein 1B-like n=1 Tax=Equus asinus TaxID=9793 RepID=UPI001D040D93|nr:coiled-coil and C2 domain-containing protein 1B-like [Equus asinus]
MGTGGRGLLKDAGPAGLPLLPGPLPMEAIEKMASLCMRDPDEEEEGTDEEDVEADDDLLAELDEVLGEEQKALEPRPPVVQVSATGPAPYSLGSRPSPAPRSRVTLGRDRTAALGTGVLGRHPVIMFEKGQISALEDKGLLRFVQKLGN